MGSDTAAVRRVRVRHGVVGPQGGGVYVSVLQRSRLLDATVSLVAELGVRQLTVRRVTARAGMSSKTFYDLFADREECLLAAFDQSVERIAGVVAPAYRAEGGWAAGMRGGLGGLLGLLDREPVLGRFVFVEALACGPRVLERRARVLEELAGVIDRGGEDRKAGRELPPFTAEGIVGAVCGVIHARLLEGNPGPLVGLLGPLMGTIVLPYRGPVAATRELSRPPASKLPAGECSGGGAHAGGGFGESPVGGSAGFSVALVEFRPTLRTFAVLAVIAERPGLNNREVSDGAGVSDQGQISRLLWRLEDQGLVQNTGGREQGTPKAWSLTARGEQALRAGRPDSVHSDSTEDGIGGELFAPVSTGVEAPGGRGV